MHVSDTDPEDLPPCSYYANCPLPRGGENLCRQWKVGLCGLVLWPLVSHSPPLRADKLTPGFAE